MPDRDSEHLTPATRLLEKRREMAEVEQALVTQKEVRIYNHSCLFVVFNFFHNCILHCI